MLISKNDVVGLFIGLKEGYFHDFDMSDTLPVVPKIYSLGEAK